MAVRLQISCFLREPQKRVKVLTLWRHEASLLPAVQQAASLLSGRHADKWYKRVYGAFEATLLNLLDENDTPIREVVIDFVAREAKRSPWRPPKDDASARPPEVEGLRRLALCFSDAVLSVRSGSGGGPASDGFAKSQWLDCLSGMGSKFEQALEGAWRRLWPGVSAASGAQHSSGEPVAPMESLRRSLTWNSENAALLSAAAQAIANMVSGLGREHQRDPARFWAAYLRQAIKVSRSFLQLAREMTLMTGLWTSGVGQEGEHLSHEVLRQEYHRVRTAFADMLTRRSREVLEAWAMRIVKEVPAYAKYLEVHRDRQLTKRLLSAVIDWWRTGHSGMLRAVCMDIVALHWSPEDESREARTNLQLEDLEAALPLFEEVVIEALERELAVRAEAMPLDALELSSVDSPRIRDILSRLTNELTRHLDSEWHIVQTSHSSARGLLPPPELFQSPNWASPVPFDFGAPKTAFLGAEVVGRYTVTRYVNRGAMGRVWVVEDRLHLEELPLCLKTFYCECECEEMSNLSTREFKRCVLEELSQVERWLTSRTRLACSKHLVRVIKVLRDAPVVRTCGGVRIEGVLSGILMEFCDKGELTSYLWDPKRHEPRSFDEPIAMYLFSQLADLLVELMAPAELPGPTPSFDSVEAAATGGILASLPRAPLLLPLSAVERSTSLATECSQESDCSSAVGTDRPRALKYFHNDIKTENLVISGTTLKLIDFQSLTPLPTSSKAFGGRPQVEHATPVYQHRHPSAAGPGLEASAEATAIWACGVILTRLLAAELDTGWVYRHNGLGTQAELEEVLPRGHTLLRASDPAGPRDLLDMIFSPEHTPSVGDVLLHPWVQGARSGPLPTRRGAEAAKQTFEERQMDCAESGGSRAAWIPLTGFLNVEGQPPPLDSVEEIIGVAVALSDGRFRQNGSRQRRCLRRASGSGELTEECFHEWPLSVAVDEDDDGVGDEDTYASPTATPSPSRAGTRAYSSSGGGATSTSRGPTSPTGRRGSISMWHSLRTRLVVDRFYVQVRVKEDLDDDEPADIWWLRVKWVPPMVTAKKDTLGSLTAVHHNGRPGFSTCSFVLLQQLLLEGRNDIAARIDRANALARRPAAPGSLMLPLFGR